MKSLPITSPHYNYLLAGYAEYLQILGYAPKTVKGWPVYVREFFHWLESKGIAHISEVTVMQQKDYMDYISRRRNRRTGGALSSGNIISMVCAIHGLGRYINSTGRHDIYLYLEPPPKEESEKNIITISQIKKLYEITFTAQTGDPLAFGQRDRAMIALYYGCGLRKSEGVQLNLPDVDLTRRLLFIRQGKGNKQRYVPIASRHVEDISDYLKEGREFIIQQSSHPEKEESPFLLNRRGQRFTQPESRLHYLLKAAGLPANITLHGLRHSIATHLLQRGMDIEDISKFLGHSSLSSTQVYTHIVNEEGRMMNNE